MMDHKPTICAGVPTIWENVRNILELRPDLKKNLNPRWDRLHVGGSALSKSLSSYFMKNFGVECHHGYGMTETNPFVSISNRSQKRKHLDWSDEKRFSLIASQGMLMPGLEWKIVNPDNPNEEIVHDGIQTGELLLRGPWIAGGYYGIDSKKYFHNGWLKTGDIVSIDPEGYMRIADRAKDLIKSGGEWISSVNLENAVKSIPGVLNACAVGVPHPKWTERPIILVVVDAKYRSKITLTKVRKHLSKEMAKFQLPDDLIFVKEIPLTGTGKMNKKAVREQLSKQKYTLPKLRSQL